MEEHVSTYTDYLMEHLTEARQTTEDALLLLEERVDYSEFVPEGFGTCDAILIADDVMHVFDFKYGGSHAESRMRGHTDGGDVQEMDSEP